VSYETTQVTSSINIDDEKVKDRWSRYIGAMGIEAVAKQAESTVFISGLGPLGVEIAKNIILAGCKELVLYDSC
jgi:molybdopterin/thiamine biosynthesis adenylyltransferase